LPIHGLELDEMDGSSTRQIMQKMP